MKRMPFRKALTITLLTSAVISTPVLADAFKHETKFSVRFGGVEIAQAQFNINFDDKSYAVKGAGKTSGLVDWLAPGKGEFKSAGAMIKNQLKPKIHTALVHEKKKGPETLKLAFANNAVSDIQFKTNKPRKARKAPKYIPVQAKHMAAVLDPASALVVPMNGADASDGRKVCNQQFPIFDGETRYNIKLRYKSTKPVKTDGYTGHAYVCQMRYVPVAGHKKDHRNVKEMAANKNMEIWLAPMNGVSVFSPIQIVVGTKYGRFSAIPKYFGGTN